MCTGCCGFRRSAARAAAFTVPAAAVVPARALLLPLLVWCALVSPVAAQTIERGTIVDPVVCASDPAQAYALYLPSTYSPDRKWSVLLAFHPAARGRLMVEKYRAAAERYGYIVAASNNSRNGPFAVSAAAAGAMMTDVERRFAIDLRRVYLTGFSGGARVSMSIALGNADIAGVIASSAGFPDSLPRSTVTFPIFGTAGIEDFNYVEMRLLDRKMSSPHFLAVFPGGHAMPPDDVAAEAIEWMEIQAMRSGRRAREDAVLRELLDKRRARLTASVDVTDTVHLLTALVSDFTGLVDVSAETARLDELSRRAEVRKALKRERDFDETEMRLLREIFGLEAQLADDNRRSEALMLLRDRLSRLRKTATAATETPERSQARRVLQAVTFGAAGRTEDQHYLAVLEQYRLRQP
jgi:predicted esterase